MLDISQRLELVRLVQFDIAERNTAATLYDIVADNTFVPTDVCQHSYEPKREYLSA